MFMTSDSVPFKIVGWLMASQQKHRELLDFAKPIKMLEFIDVETNSYRKPTGFKFKKMVTRNYPSFV